MNTETQQIELTAGNIKTAMKNAGASSSDLWMGIPAHRDQ